MGDSSSSSTSGGGAGGKLHDSGAIELTGKVMVAAVLVVFLVIVFVFFLHVYAKWFWQLRSQDNTTTTTTTRRRRRRRFDFAPGYLEQEGEANGAVTRHGGLDPCVLKTIPVVVVGSSMLKDDGMECAVCLSEISEGEKIRLLPKCNNHGFHVECIDMWFQSHSTCPLCRSPVSDDKNTNDPNHDHPDDDDDDRSRVLMESPSPPPTHASSTTTEPVNFPTNMLFWGDETRVLSQSSCSEMEEGRAQGQGVSFDNNDGSNSQTSTRSSSSSSTSLSRYDRPDGEGMVVIDIPTQGINDDDDDQEQQQEEEKTPRVGRRLRSFKRLLIISSRDRKVSPRSDVDVVDLEQQGSTSQS